MRDFEVWEVTENLRLNEDRLAIAVKVFNFSISLSGIVIFSMLGSLHMMDLHATSTVSG
jgi:hypothetical protein